MDIPIELFQLILEQSDFLTQIRFRCVDKLFYTKLEIHDFWNIKAKYSKLLTDEILQLHSFVTDLTIVDNPNITNINHMTRLKKLFIFGKCNIDNTGISNVNVKYLNLRYYDKITNVNHMSILEILYANSRTCGIDNAGIANLNLVALYAADNTKITNVNHMTNLQVLEASGTCGIGDDGIRNLNLIKLDAGYNKKITNVNHMTRLEILDAGWRCGINSGGISNLNLKELYADYNPRIKAADVAHMHNLRIVSMNVCPEGQGILL